MTFEPRFYDLVSMIESSVAQFGDRPAFGQRGPEGWRWTTVRELGTVVANFRSGLASLGAWPGDRIAAISNNRLEWAVGAYAVFGLGAIYVPMYESQLDVDWKYL